MRKWIVLFTIIAFGKIVFGQVDWAKVNPERSRLTFTIPVSNAITDKNIESIGLLFRSDTINRTDVAYFSDSVALYKILLPAPFIQNYKSYDFGFEGDRIAFRLDTRDIKRPFIPNIRLMDLKGKNELLSSFVLTGIRMYRDSTTYYYRDKQYLVPLLRFGAVARYLGDLKQIEQQIQEKIKDKGIVDTKIDSIYLFRAIIKSSLEKQDGIDKIESMELLTPNNDLLSEEIIKIFLRKENTFFADGRSKWLAGVNINNGQKTTTRIKILVRIKRDGSAGIEFSKILGNWTGD